MPVIRLVVRPAALFCAVILFAIIGKSLGQSVTSRVNGPIRVMVDASDARRKLFHVKMAIPVSAGKLTLNYPKWIPGEHEPSGPIANLLDLQITARGQSVAWRRSDTDMYAFACQVPEGVDTVEIIFDYASPLTTTNGFVNGHNANATDRLVVLNWNTMLLYPASAKPAELMMAATLRLPEGWKYGTALQARSEADGVIAFEPTSLETLIDSPVLAGIYFRSIDLTPNHVLDLAADSPEALNIRPQILDSLRRLPGEATAVFGLGHYRRYHFLLALSDRLTYYGLEHHESSDDRIYERTLIDEPMSPDFADLLAHEFTHSWNGKYRRPTGLITADYQEPMRSDLLWVYEGLTTYYGYVLGARCGLMSPEWFQDFVARYAASMDTESGRAWRSLEDTAIASQILESAPSEWAGRRRSLDYYPEGVLLWLEVDSIIRKQSAGARTLDDFAHTFYYGDERKPSVRAYTFDDVVAALDHVVQYDWRGFFEARVRRVSERPPLAGIENDGWRLDYTDAPSLVSPAGFGYSLGFWLNEDGVIGDVRAGSAADRAGLGPGMKLIGVNGRHFTPVRLHEAVARTQSSVQAIELLVESGDYFRTVRVEYQGGERYPHLVRQTDRPDVFAQLLKSHAATH